MKIKINPFYIICVIIFELIIINFLFIVIFFRNNNTDSITNKDNKSAAIQNKAAGKDKQNKIAPKSQQVKIHEKKRVPVKKKHIPEKVKIMPEKEQKVHRKVKQVPAKQKPETKKDSLIGLSLKKNEKAKINYKLIDRFFNVNRNNSYMCFQFANQYLIVEKDDFIATAYDLSYQSCGKYPEDTAYGITFSGTKAVKGRTIAIDPNVIPLGSKVYVEFPKEYRNLDGWYFAEDTGKKVKGKIIDVFLGKSALKEAMQFGRRKVKLKIQIKVVLK